MENSLKPYLRIPASSSPSKLAVHRDSHVISKFKPKVRIIHIFAPEIIKTDVANFRELVQRLTGKPCESKGSYKKKRRSSSSSKKVKTSCFSESNKKAIQLQDGFPSLNIEGEKLKLGQEENEIWEAEKSSGFLDGFADLNGFMHDLSDNVSLAAAPQSSHHANVFEDLHLS